MQTDDLVIEDVPIDAIRRNGRLRPTDPEKVEQIADSIAKIGLLHPLILSSDRYLLAGNHRYDALKLLNQSTARCSILPYPHDSPEAELYALDENLMRSDLTVLEQAEYLLRRERVLAQMGRRAKRGDNRNSRPDTVTGLETTASLAKEAGLSPRSLNRRLQIARNLTDEQRAIVHGTPLANEQKELLEIARIKDPERRTGVIELMIGDRPPLTVNDAVRQYRIKMGEISADLDIIKPSNWWAFGRPKWQQEFPGGIPGEVYANALYYFAPDSGVVADGMAGSGMLQRVYDDRTQWQQGRRLDLEIRLYDLYPRPPFSLQYGIKRHDMIQPLPEPVDWLFIDPPYFKIAAHLFEGELAKTTSYTRYCELMSSVIQAAWQSLRENGVFLLFITPYLDISKSKNDPLDVPADLWRIALKVGFVPVQRVYVSRGEQQRRSAGMMNLKAKASRRMFSDVCELMVFARPEVR